MKSQKEQYRKALENYEKELSSKQDDVTIYYNMGWTYGEMGNYNEALRNYEKALTLKPNDASIYYNMGWNYEKLGNDEEAVKNYNKASELNPDDADTYYNIACIYGKQGNIEDALTNYEKALELNPNDANTYFCIGLCHKILKNTEEALKNHQKALEIYKKQLDLYPNEIKNYYNIGLTYEYLGDSDKASENYKIALENYTRELSLNSNDADIYFKIGMISEKLKNLEEALKNYEKALELNKDDFWLKEKVKTLKNKKDLNNTQEKKLMNNENINLKINDYQDYQKESKGKKEKKFLTFADILGWKGIWQKDKQIDSMSINIDKMKFVKNGLISLKNELLKKFPITNNTESFANINLISDTFIIASNNIEIHNKLCKKLVSLCLEKFLLIRGATSYGEYLSEDTIYIGEAVDEAASWHELAEEAAIFYTVSARLKLEEILDEKFEGLAENDKEQEENKNNKINNYLKEIELTSGEVELKKGKIDTYLISWIDDEENRTQFKEIMKKEIIYPEIFPKYYNTEKRIKNFKDNLRYKKEK